MPKLIEGVPTTPQCSSASSTLAPQAPSPPTAVANAVVSAAAAAAAAANVDMDLVVHDGATTIAQAPPARPCQPGILSAEDNAPFGEILSEDSFAAAERRPVSPRAMSDIPDAMPEGGSCLTSTPPLRRHPFAGTTPAGFGRHALDLPTPPRASNRPPVISTTSQPQPPPHPPAPSTSNTDSVSLSSTFMSSTLVSGRGTSCGGTAGPTWPVGERTAASAAPPETHSVARPRLVPTFPAFSSSCSTPYHGMVDVAKMLPAPHLDEPFLAPIHLDLPLCYDHNLYSRGISHSTQPQYDQGYNAYIGPPGGWPVSSSASLSSTIHCPNFLGTLAHNAPSQHCAIQVTEPTSQTTGYPTNGARGPDAFALTVGHSAATSSTSPIAGSTLGACPPAPTMAQALTAAFGVHPQAQTAPKQGLRPTAQARAHPQSYARPEEPSAQPSGARPPLAPGADSTAENVRHSGSQSEGMRQLLLQSLFQAEGEFERMGRTWERLQAELQGTRSFPACPSCHLPNLDSDAAAAGAAAATVTTSAPASNPIVNNSATDTKHSQSMGITPVLPSAVRPSFGLSFGPFAPEGPRVLPASIEAANHAEPRQSLQLPHRHAHLEPHHENHYQCKHQQHFQPGKCEQQQQLHQHQHQDPLPHAHHMEDHQHDHQQPPEANLEGSPSRKFSQASLSKGGPNLPFFSTPTKRCGRAVESLLVPRDQESDPGSDISEYESPVDDYIQGSAVIVRNQQAFSDGLRSPILLGVRARWAALQDCVTRVRERRALHPSIE